MINTGDLRFDKIMPRIKDSWLKLPFENCLNEKTGGYKKLKKNDLRKSGKIPVVDQGERFITGYTNDESNLYQGGLPVVIFGDHTRRIKYIDFDFAVGADGTKLLHPFEALSPKFFYHYLKALNLDSQGYSRHYRFLKQIEVPIPPINEQHRIVTKLEKLLEKVDKCRERLGKIPTILKRFRQSVLAAACSGELTADWRRENLNVEVENIFKRIDEKRKKHYREECEKAKAGKRRKPRKPTNIDEKVRFENLDQFVSIPATWFYIPLGKVAAEGADSIVDGPFGTSINVKTDYIDSGVPVVRINNIRALTFLPENLRFISKAKFQNLKRHNIIPGDVLLTKVGTIGESCVFPSSFKEAMLSTTGSCRIRVDEKLAVNKYICLYLNSIKPFLNDIASESLQSFLNMKVIKNIPTALPPLEEQHEIVRLAESLFMVADQIETRFEKARAHVNSLTQSILAKAFRGELVPQDPNDEPASELLKRIQTEREQAKQKESKTRKIRKPFRKRKKSLQASDKDREPDNAEKPERKKPSPVPVEKEDKAQKTKRKPLEVPTRRPQSLVDLDQQTIMAAFRKACRNRGEISREDFLKVVASSLGYQRLRAKLRVKLQGDMRAAMMRGIIKSNGDMIVPATQNTEDYNRDDLIKYACSVTKKGKLYEQDTVIRDTLKHLGFQRITERMRKVVTSAIRNGIRKGLFVRDKGIIFRP